MAKKSDFYRGLVHAIPVCIAFFFLCIAYGAITSEKGLSFYQAVGSTIFIFALPLQLLLIKFHDLSSIWPVVALAFMINFRFFLMSATLMKYFKKIPTWKLLLSFTLLSASPFSIAFTEYKKDKEMHHFKYFLGVSLASFVFAVGPTAIGFYANKLIDSPYLMTVIMMLLPINYTILLSKHLENKKLLIATVLGFIAMPFISSYIPKMGLIIIPLIIGGLCLIKLDFGRSSSSRQ